MNKSLTFSFFICFFLASCSKQTQPYNSFQEARAALITLNAVLIQQDVLNDQKIKVEQIPFTEAYLTKRHEIYQRLMEMDLSPAQAEQVNYLVIAERFPERYFTWPAQINVLANMLALDASNAGIGKANQWLKFTQIQLDNAKQSNLKLNKIELTMLQGYVASMLVEQKTPTTLLPQLNRLNYYLSQYKPRGSAGMRGLANGSEWYQSKLNYFSGAVHSPLEWVTLLDKQIKTLDRAVLKFKGETNYQQSFLVQFLESDKQAQAQGLDWLTKFKTLPVLAQNKAITAADKTLMLALMETDVGIHYHAWTLPQAKVNLIKRLDISESDAQYLVKDIVLYPAQSFSFAQQVL
jgi:uncharacterized protein (DUF885 family)